MSETTPRIIDIKEKNLVALQLNPPISIWYAFSSDGRTQEIWLTFSDPQIHYSFRGGDYMIGCKNLLSEIPMERVGEHQCKDWRGRCARGSIKLNKNTKNKIHRTLLVILCLMYNPQCPISENNRTLSLDIGTLWEDLKYYPDTDTPRFLITVLCVT